jgi:hypothetical protein
MGKPVQIPRGWLVLALMGVGAWILVTIILLLTATSGVARADQRPVAATPRPSGLTFVREIGKSSPTPTAGVTQTAIRAAGVASTAAGSRVGASPTPTAREARSSPTSFPTRTAQPQGASPSAVPPPVIAAAPPLPAQPREAAQVRASSLQSNEVAPASVEAWEEPIATPTAMQLPLQLLATPAGLEPPPTVVPPPTPRPTERPAPALQPTPQRRPTMSMPFLVVPTSTPQVNRPTPFPYPGAFSPLMWPTPLPQLP